MNSQAGTEILVRGPNWLGDLIMSTPGLRSLRAGFPEAKITLQVRPGLERLCRYIARPAVAQDRVAIQPNGDIAYTLKSPWRDGTTALTFAPLDFIARLAALVPPPRANLVRYHGVFAPAARLRPKIVGQAPNTLAMTMGHKTANNGSKRRRRNLLR